MSIEEYSKVLSGQPINGVIIAALLACMACI